jgi:glycosyltransferase involved in cell wall biosynthesis
MKRTIALVDYEWGGHHKMYIQLYTRILLELGHAVIVATSEADEFREWIADTYQDKGVDLGVVKLSKVFDEPLVPIFRSAQKLSAKWSRVNYVLQIIEANTSRRIDLVFFNYLDEMLGPIPRVMQPFVLRKLKYDFSGLLFHVHDLIAESKSLAGHLAGFEVFLKQNNCKSLATLVESKSRELEKITGKRVVDFPDIAYNYIAGGEQVEEIASQIKQKAGGRKVVCSVGSLASRKGIIPLLKAAENMDELFVFAGKLTDTFSPADLTYLKDKMANPPENVLFISRYLTDSEVDTIIVNSNLVYAAYLNFKSSSNMLAKAAIHRKPILVSEGGLMAQRVAKFGTGITTRQADTDEIQLKLKQLLDADLSEFAGGFDQLLKVHSVENQKQQFIKLLG